MQQGDGQMKEADGSEGHDTQISRWTANTQRRSGSPAESPELQAIGVQRSDVAAAEQPEPLVQGQFLEEHAAAASKRQQQEASSSGEHLSPRMPSQPSAAEADSLAGQQQQEGQLLTDSITRLSALEQLAAFEDDLQGLLLPHSSARSFTDGGSADTSMQHLASGKTDQLSRAAVQQQAKRHYDVQLPSQPAAMSEPSCTEEHLDEDQKHGQPIPSSIDDTAFSSHDHLHEAQKKSATMSSPESAAALPVEVH